MKYRSFLITIAIVISIPSCKKVNEKIPTNDHKLIPFEITDANNISIKSIINNIDTVKLMFHTAVSSISIIEDSLEKIPSVNFGDTIDVKSWGGESSSIMSQNNTIKFGQLNFSQQHISICKHSGHFTDGKMGYNYFEEKLLKIDFNNNRLEILDNLNSIDTSYKKSKLKIENGSMYMQAEIEIKNIIYTKWLLIHSGYSKTILLDDKFVAEQNLNSNLKVINESELKDSYGNTLKTKNVELPKITISNHHFANLNVGIFEGKISNQTMSIIGCEILKKFNIVVDFQNQDIYLQKSKYF